MKLNHKSIFDQLETNAGSLEKLLSNVLPEQRGWKPAPEKWSLQEILCHLYDEEREDFRPRVLSILEDPLKPWPPIFPQQWVSERDYATWNYHSTLTNFLHERQQSVECLRSLSSPNWLAAHDHPQEGLLSAEAILANWLAHDYLHMRQIINLKYLYLADLAKPHSLQYAGIEEPDLQLKS